MGEGAAMTESPGRVLIGYGHAIAAVETARSLLRAGFSVVAFERDDRRSLLRHLRGVEVHTIPFVGDDPGGAKGALVALAESVRPAVLMPLDDASLWLASELSERGDLPIDCVTSHSCARFALDKRKQVEAALEAGLSVPTTSIWSEADREPAVPDGPVIVRPALAYRVVGKGAGRGRVQMFERGEELRALLGDAPPEPALVQPFVRGQGEGMFGWAGRDGVVGWSAHRRLRMIDPHGSGSAACESVDVDPSLTEAAERLVRSVGWRGQFMIELLRDDDGTAHFVEFNGRPWGSMALARRRGYEYPAWTALGALDADYVPDPPVDPPHVTARHLARDLVHLASVFRGPKRPVPSWPSRRGALRDVLGKRRGEAWYNFEDGDVKLWLLDTLLTLKSYLPRRGRR
ncbi:MAG: hypothetical protein AAGA20_07680 [Planctomycetota bacterium]